MIFIVLTILFSTAIIITFRLIGLLKLNELQSITFNYFFAVIYGMLIWQEPFTLNSYTTKSWFDLSLLIGVLFIITFILLSRSTLKAGVSITAVASRMSVIIPVSAGFVIFNDSVSALKIMGILLAIFSFYLIFEGKGVMKVKWKNVVLPLLLFLGIGTNDTMMKYVEFNHLAGDETLFLTIVFFAAFMMSFVALVIQIASGKEKFSAINIISGFILGSLNFGSTYFFIKSMSLFESSFLFPVFNVGIVVLTSVIGLTVFKEKLSRINWLGIGLAMLALLLITNA